MRRSVRCVIGLMIVTGVVGLLCDSVSALSAPAWLSKPIVKIGEVATEPVGDTALPCAGYSGAIEVIGEEGVRDACVFGNFEGIRIARYRDAGDTILYAVSFLANTKFYTVRGLCTGVSRCIYSQNTDTLLIETPTPDGATYRIARHVKDHLKRYDGVIQYYRLEYSGTPEYMRLGEAYVPIGTSAITTDGHWLFMEVRGYGFVRMDMTSFESKRIVANDSMPIRTTLTYEVAISDDGAWMALTGHPAGVLVYKAEQGCGDILTDTSTMYFASNTIACGSTLVQRSSLFPNTTAVHAPKLSLHGEYLRLLVEKNGAAAFMTFAPSPQSLGNSWYVALGDSFTSGEGEESDDFYFSSTNTATNHCHVSKRSYPLLMGDVWAFITSNLACSGARIDEVRKVSHTIVEGNSLPPTVLSVGVGGNDVGLMGKLKGCVGPGTCEWATSGKRASSAYEIRGLFSKMVNFVAELKRNFPTTPLIIVGYPSVVNEEVGAHCSPLIGVLFDASERRYMSESITYMNAILKAVAVYTKSTYVDIEDTLQGERLCDATERAMNGVRYGDDIAPIPLLNSVRLFGAESFHPTARGHQLIATAMSNQLQSFWESNQCFACDFSEEMLTPAEYWFEGTGFNEPILKQLAVPFLKTEVIIDRVAVEYSFAPGNFNPDSKVTFEIHSTPIKLEVTTARSDGSLSGVLEIPKGVRGYHTVHAIGENFSGEKIDMYQTVYIDTGMVAQNSLVSSTGKSPVHAEPPDNIATISDWHETESVFENAGVLGSLMTLNHDRLITTTSSKKADLLWPIIVGVGCLLCIPCFLVAYGIRKSIRDHRRR